MHRRIRLAALATLTAVLAAVSLGYTGYTAQAQSRFDAAALIKGYETYRQMRQTAPTAGVPWQYLGPTNVSGRATDVAIADKGGRRSIYVGYATSGVWKSDDNGGTWSAIFEHMPSTSIGDVAVAPSNPDIVRRSESVPRVAGGRRHLQIDRRRQDLAAHGSRRYAHDRAHRRPSH
jgi:hypothetical protein